MRRRSNCAMWRSTRCWTSVRAVGLRLRRHWRPGAAGSRRWPRVTGMARSTIDRGLSELRGETVTAAAPDRIRRKGGAGANRWLSRTRRYFPISSIWLSRRRAAIRWRRCCGRQRAFAVWRRGFAGLGHRICHKRGGRSAARHGLQFAGQSQDPRRDEPSDRDAQFGYINDQVKQALAASEPAISVDTKKKELVGDFKNGGREYRPKGEPSRYGCTTSLSQNLAGRRPMASTTSPTTQAG